MKTFLITGVSSGLGRAFAEGALGAGHTVVGTVRREADREPFEALAPGRAPARRLDVTDDVAVRAVVEEAEATVGPLDVAIANAGYGLEGIFEETRERRAGGSTVLAGADQGRSPWEGAVPPRERETCAS
ncbi:SDR family NAD(P)-dependent oxidoreductase, partial [Streptomyces javensis]|uniref:SDR family NAD(P)-dependent oxidoreductase n=1 Tax=Streptomyces javensis TaxID=114698 RepID=UPI003D157013